MTSPPSLPVPVATSAVRNACGTSRCPPAPPAARRPRSPTGPGRSTRPAPRGGPGESRRSASATIQPSMARSVSSSPTGSGSESVTTSATRAVRRRQASMARCRAVVNSQARTEPRPGRALSGCRQARSSVSWTRSSARCRSPPDSRRAWPNSASPCSAKQRPHQLSVFALRPRSLGNLRHVALPPVYAPGRPAGSRRGAGQARSPAVGAAPPVRRTLRRHLEAPRRGHVAVPPRQPGATPWPSGQLGRPSSRRPPRPAGPGPGRRPPAPRRRPGRGGTGRSPTASPRARRRPGRPPAPRSSVRVCWVYARIPHSRRYRARCSAVRVASSALPRAVACAPSSKPGIRSSRYGERGPSANAVSTTRPPTKRPR